MSKGNGVLFPPSDNGMSHIVQESAPRIRYQSEPPPKRETFWVERLKPNSKCRLIVYSPALWGVWTHWTKDGTKPCYEDHSFCHLGHKEETLRWYGYLFGWHIGDNRAVFLQLTDGACRQLLSQLAPKAPIRGLAIDAWTTPKKRGRMHAQVAETMHRDPATLPPDHDPERSLYKLWGVSTAEQRMHKSLVSGPEEIPGESET